jgi:hypothetical protein
MHQRLEKPNGNLGIGRARLDVFEHTRRRNHADRVLRVALRKDAQAFLGRVAQNRARKLKDELCVLLECRRRRIGLVDQLLQILDNLLGPAQLARAECAQRQWFGTNNDGKQISGEKTIWISHREDNVTKTKTSAWCRQSQSAFPERLGGAHGCETVQ